jgi:hypothetical protein
VLELFRGIRIGLRAGVDHAMSRADFIVPLRAELGDHLTEGLALGFEVACASAELGPVSVPEVVSQASVLFVQGSSL